MLFPSEPEPEQQAAPKSAPADEDSNITDIDITNIVVSADEE